MRSAPIGEVARGKWRQLLPALGVHESFLTGKHRPCPSCGGKDRFRFTDHQQSGGYVCNACGNGDGVDLLRKVRGWTFEQCADEIRALVGDLQPDPAPRVRPKSSASSQRLWKSAVSIGRGDHVARYLAARALPGPYSDDLRYLAACPVTNVEGVQALPAMLALIRDPQGNPVMLHRTYLGDGAKADIESPRRLMFCDFPLGGAIRLAPHNGILGIAEGIETALAVTRDTGIPCWAATSARQITTFAWPDGLAELHIFGDHDANHTGHVAAYSLSNRAQLARNAPAAVRIHIPERVGDDWLDDGNRRRNAAK